MMVPIDLEILIHYHCSPEDYRGGDHSAPAVRDSIRWFLAEGLLCRRPEQCEFGAQYETTPRGRTLIEEWCKTPLPTKVWVTRRESA